jgi:1-acyl-sn-glycerol-3-phosphate acyltransferase
MRRLRACLRLPLLFVPVLLLFPAALATRLLVRCGVRRLGTRWAADVQRCWARWTLCWMGVRLERVGSAGWSRGAQRADRPDGSDGGGPPDEATLLVSNHVSWLDILVLASCWRCRFVAKSEIARWPLFGWMSRAVGTLYVARGLSRDVVTVRPQLSDTLAAGVHPLVFPEGRATAGHSVHAFRSALLEFAHREALSSVAVGLTYRVEDAAPVAAEQVAWHDGTPLWEHVVRVLGYRRVIARVACSGPHAAAPRRLLAAQLEREVARLTGLPLESAAEVGTGHVFPHARA